MDRRDAGQRGQLGGFSEGKDRAGVGGRFLVIEANVFVPGWIGRGRCLARRGGGGGGAACARGTDMSGGGGDVSGAVATLAVGGRARCVWAVRIAGEVGFGGGIPAVVVVLLRGLEQRAPSGCGIAAAHAGGRVEQRPLVVGFHAVGAQPGPIVPGEAELGVGHAAHAAVAAAGSGVVFGDQATGAAGRGRREAGGAAGGALGAGPRAHLALKP